MDRKRKIKNLNILKNSEGETSKKGEKKRKKIEKKKEKAEKSKVIENKDEIDDTIILDDLKDGEDLSKGDPFELQMKNELSPELLKLLSEKPVKCEKSNVRWSKIGDMIVYKHNLTSSGQKLMLETKEFCNPRPLPKISNFDMDKLFINKQIKNNIKEKKFSDLQNELLTLFCNYHDVYFPEETFENMEEIRQAYCIHAMNHVTKSRLKIIHHNNRMANHPDEEYKDQGLVRPKVLIIVPFRDSALKVVKSLTEVGLSSGGTVMNKKRFFDDYSGDTINMPEKNPRPVDYQLLFSGNTDDSFKIGLTVTKKCVKLYASFYQSDIIIASPLGLRMLIGAEGESERDYDYLASIELLIMDQSQLFFMQNWEHLLHIMSHLHLQPQESHGTDLGRVRMWALNGWSKYYRQTLIFSSNPLPVITALFNIHCNNYNGKVAVANNVALGSISQVALSIPQVFHYVNSSSVTESIDDRFETFISDVWPQFKDSSMNHTLIYIPSYFDFVKLRNYFKRQEMKFVHICEYTEEKKLIRARSKFFHGETQFLLYTERFHFFRRPKLRGIKHLIFYQPPTFPSFYSEMCNFLQDLKSDKTEGETEMTVNTIYTKFDITQIAAIVGTERATRMLASDKPLHMFMTDS